jgi:hypothetical protein
MNEKNQGELLYAKILEEAKVDENILGFFLTAGRGKGVVTEKSDYDVFLIVREGSTQEYKAKYEKQRIQSVFDLLVFSLAEFGEYAKIGSAEEWDRYNFAHLKAQIDKGGIQDLIDEKGSLPEEKIQETVENNLGGYFNLYYRSKKNQRDGNFLASHLDGAESALYFLTALFAMNGKMRPYNKYLEWELKNFPLEKTAWGAEDLIVKIQAIVSSGDMETQDELFRKSRELFYANGFVQTITDWRDCFPE